MVLVNDDEDHKQARVRDFRVMKNISPKTVKRERTKVCYMCYSKKSHAGTDHVQAAILVGCLL